MNSSFINKYKPAIILTLALTVFLASCKGTSDSPKWVVSTLAGSSRGYHDATGTARRSFATPTTWPWIYPAMSMWRIIATTAYGKSSHQQGW